MYQMPLSDLSGSHTRAEHERQEEETTVDGQISAKTEKLEEDGSQNTYFKT